MTEDETRAAIGCLLELLGIPAIEGRIDAVVSQADIWQALRIRSLQRIDDLHAAVLKMRQNIKGDVRSEIVDDFSQRIEA
ncbi:MAG: hypothetical protein JSV16_08650 [Candidatus Hydrogenedentota bacterium]|nr:MAG: hypothetical protein JSV16_08650 [Candidatus Hydrogenedentota bacterium]